MRVPLDTHNKLEHNMFYAAAFALAWKCSQWKIAVPVMAVASATILRPDSRDASSWGLQVGHTGKFLIDGLILANVVGPLMQIFKSGNIPLNPWLGATAAWAVLRGVDLFKYDDHKIAYGVSGQWFKAW